MAKEQKRVLEGDDLQKRGRTIAQPVRIPVQKGSDEGTNKPKKQSNG